MAAKRTDKFKSRLATAAKASQQVGKAYLDAEAVLTEIEERERREAARRQARRTANAT